MTEQSKTIKVGGGGGFRVLHHTVYPDQMVTANLYLQQLNWVNQTLHRKKMNTVSTKFLNDNTRLHIAKNNPTVVIRHLVGYRVTTSSECNKDYL